MRDPSSLRLLLQPAAAAVAAALPASPPAASALAAAAPGGSLPGGLSLDRLIWDMDRSSAVARVRTHRVSAL